jgi:hypothetical protein
VIVVIVVIVVIDASVVLKWLLEDPACEPDTQKTVTLIESVVSGSLEVLQPVRWLAEVAAVAARLTPQTAVPMSKCWPRWSFRRPMTRTSSGGQRTLLSRPIIICLTRCIALEHADAVLVTADDRYYGKAERYGTIAALRDCWGGVP